MIKAGICVPPSRLIRLLTPCVSLCFSTRAALGSCGIVYPVCIDLKGGADGLQACPPALLLTTASALGLSTLASVSRVWTCTLRVYCGLTPASLPSSVSPPPPPIQMMPKEPTWNFEVTGYFLHLDRVLLLKILESVVGVRVLDFPRDLREPVLVLC